MVLPIGLCEKCGIEVGDVIRLVELDGVFVCTPMLSTVPALAAEIEQSRLGAGLRMDELLFTLRKQRERYDAETL